MPSTWAVAGTFEKASEHLAPSSSATWKHQRPQPGVLTGRLCPQSPGAWMAVPLRFPHLRYYLFASEVLMSRLVHGPQHKSVSVRFVITDLLHKWWHLCELVHLEASEH